MGKQQLHVIHYNPVIHYDPTHDSSLRPLAGSQCVATGLLARGHRRAYVGGRRVKRSPRQRHKHKFLNRQLLDHDNNVHDGQLDKHMYNLKQRAEAGV